MSVREQRHLSIEDVSNHLRLSLRQVKALESDDFAALPEAVITRGFIRNYARMLEIDAEPLLQAYHAYVPDAGPHAFTIQSANILIAGNDKRPWAKYILASLLVALLLGAWLIYLDYTARKPAQQAAATALPAVNADSKPMTESSPVAALPAAERNPEETPSTETIPAEVPQAPVATASNQVATGDAGNQAPVVTPALATLKFTFSDQTWVRVVDRDNKEIFNKTKPAGSEDMVQGQPPFKVVIGNVAGSKLVFNDKPVDLAPYTKLNVARLTLE